MRDFYPVTPEGAAAKGSGTRAYERHVLQVCTLGFWIPCCIADLWALATGGVGAAAFVFWLLFREAVVFLALWGGASLAHGLMWGSRAPKEPDARHRRKLKSILAADPKGYIAPTRGNRGQ